MDLLGGVERRRRRGPAAGRQRGRSSVAHPPLPRQRQWRHRACHAEGVRGRPRSGQENKRGRTPQPGRLFPPEPPRERPGGPYWAPNGPNDGRPVARSGVAFEGGWPAPVPAPSEARRNGRSAGRGRSPCPPALRGAPRPRFPPLVLPGRTLFPGRDTVRGSPGAAPRRPQDRPSDQ